MAASQTSNTKDLKQLEDKFKQLELTLPKELWLGNQMLLYQGFWCLFSLEGTISFQTHFQAHDNDIILTSFPKTGTTWLKSLIFTVVNRRHLSNNISQHPSNNKNPHELVPHFETVIYKKIVGDQPDLSKVPSPRLFATHVPYSSLPESIKTSKCKIVYICRNPLDTFVSTWKFLVEIKKSKGSNLDDEMMNECFDKFCQGKSPNGPYDNHVLEYWKESIQNPERVLFLEYEGLKKEPRAHLKRLAEFIGHPFSEEEEKGNVIDEVIEQCSLKKLKEMEVNKNGKFYDTIENKVFFRKGEVGDWCNHLTPSMAKQLDQTLNENLKKAGFSQKYYQANIQFDAQ